MQTVGIIDYGAGNLASVRNSMTYAAECLGGKVLIKTISKPDDIKNSDKIVLPGVGAFSNCYYSLKKKGFVEPLIDFISNIEGKFLGICVGMQVLADYGLETSSAQDKKCNGLGIISGMVRSLKEEVNDNVIIPHIGWNNLIIKKYNHHIFKGFSLKKEIDFYFVHSYIYKNIREDYILASCLYGGVEFPALIGYENIIAAQFHPEKSLDAGIGIFKNFIDWD